MHGKLLDPGVLEALSHLEFVTRRRFRGTGAGERPGGVAGGRGEFSGHAPYVPGADFRDIDWNLAARHDALQVREFRREEAIPVRIFLDASGSMAWGRPSKFDLARRLAAGLAWIALARHDPVRLACARGHRSDEGRLFRGPGAFPEVVRELEGHEAGGALELSRAIHEALRHDPDAALSFWITDGYGGKEARGEVRRLPGRAQDAVLLLVSAAEEIDPAAGGNVRLADSETGEEFDLALGPGELRRYREAYAAFAEEWRTLALTSGVRFAWVRTDQPLEDLFFRVFTRAGVLA
ncbi:MAG: DUF58 domain-containing protein [Planctomycetes bacterium]|nr:DUF58 domain-containing protein [Planctomycetota bacterium]